MIRVDHMFKKLTDRLNCRIMLLGSVQQCQKFHSSQKVGLVRATDLQNLQQLWMNFRTSLWVLRYYQQWCFVLVNGYICILRLVLARLSTLNGSLYRWACHNVKYTHESSVLICGRAVNWQLVAICWSGLTVIGRAMSTDKCMRPAIVILRDMLMIISLLHTVLRTSSRASPQAERSWAPNDALVFSVEIWEANLWTALSPTISVWFLVVHLGTISI